MSARNGGCHCGAVRFQVDLPDTIEARTCTCSMCEKTGFIHIIVPESRFAITAGEDAITTYTFNTGVAKHTFCSVCGVKAFYRPRSNPDGWSVNARCLDVEGSPEIVLVEPFDGKNWEAYAASHDITHLSREDA